MSQIERAADLLFPVNGSQTRNIKFLCAGRNGVDAEELAAMVVRAELQVREGVAKPIRDVDSYLTVRS